MQLASYRSIWTISFPIIFSLLAQNITGVVNTMFLSGVGIVELDASAIGSLYYFVLFMLGFGFTTGTQILISRRNGERNYRKIGALMENCWYFLLLGSILLIVASTTLTPRLLKGILSTDRVLEATVQFIDYRIYGLFFAYMVASFRAFHVGTTRSGLLMYSGVIMAGVNVFLDYVLIFGNWGFPELGLKGAAIASIIAEFSAMIFLLAYNFTARNRIRYGLYRFRKPDFKVLGEVLSISIYVMVLYFISVGSSLAFFFIVEQTGERNLAASNIVRSIYGVAMLPIWAYTSTVSSLVSNAIGAAKIHCVIPTIRRVCMLGMLTSLGISLVLVALGRYILIPYTLSDSTLIDFTLPSLYMVAISNIIFGGSSIIFNGINGTGKTNVSLMIELLALAFYLATAFWFVQWFPQTIALAWSADIIYWVIIAILSIAYLRWGGWKRSTIANSFRG